MAIIITVTNRNGKGKTWTFGGKFHVLAAAVETSVSAIRHESKMTGMELLTITEVFLDVIGKKMKEMFITEKKLKEMEGEKHGNHHHSVKS